MHFWSIKNTHFLIRKGRAPLLQTLKIMYICKFRLKKALKLNSSSPNTNFSEGRCPAQPPPRGPAHWTPVNASRKRSVCSLRSWSCKRMIYTIFALPGSSGWQNSPTRTTQLKTRLDAAVAMRVYSISAGLCTNHEILHTYLPFYIWSWYIYEMKVHIKYIYYYKFETKLLLITNKN